VQVLKGIAANSVILCRQAEATVSGTEQDGLFSATLFAEVDSAVGLDFQHTENPFFDFGNRRPLPQKYSQMGPCTATGDMNGDGLDDVFVGGAANQSGRLFFQQKHGTFRAENLVEGQKPEEDLGAYLFDADADGDLDLLLPVAARSLVQPSTTGPGFMLTTAAAFLPCRLMHCRPV
jgi:hypothetical protein